MPTNRKTLKTYFNTGDKPTETHFGEVIDGNLNLVDGGTVVGATTFTNHITASGNISASGTIYASDFQSAGASGETISFNDDLNIAGDITASGNITGSTIGGQTVVVATFLSAPSASITNLLSTNITASGNISASGTIFADNFQSAGGDDQISFIDNLNITGHITASGNISSSGYISSSGLIVGGTGNFVKSPSISTGTITCSGVFLHPVFSTDSITAKVIASKNLAFGSLITGGVGRLNIQHDDTDGTISNLTGDLSITNNNGDTIIKNTAGGGKILLNLDLAPQSPINSGVVLISGSAEGGISLDVRGNITSSGNILSSGSIVHGNVSASGNIVAGGFISSSGRIQTLSHITASGNISSSGHISSSGLIVAGGAQVGALVATTLDTGQGANELFDMNQNVTTTSNVFFGFISASGDISGSTIIGENIHSLGHITASGRIQTLSHITASGNISSSGYISSSGLIVGGTGNFVKSPSISTGTITCSGVFLHPVFSTDSITAKVIASKNLAFGSLITGGVGRLNIQHDDTDGTISNLTGDLSITNNNGDTIIKNTAGGGKILLNLDLAPQSPINSGVVLISGSAEGGISLDVRGNITSSGNILSSGSIVHGNVSASGNIVAGGFISSSGRIQTLSHITASGNISSSGHISSSGLIVAGGAQVGALVATTINTGQGATEVHLMNQDVKTTDAVVFTTINTGQGATEVHLMDQNVREADAVVFATVNTGQGANELYDMDQNVTTTSNVFFGFISASGDISGSNLDAGGNISAVGHITASGRLQTLSHITASGNISSSGTIFAKSFVETVSTKVAAGSDLAGAAAVDGTNVIFATTDDAAKGVRLPALTTLSIGQTITVHNEAASTALRVYPSSGDVIGGLAEDGHATVPAKTAIVLTKRDANKFLGYFTTVIA